MVGTVTGTRPIPLLDLKAQLARIRPEIDEAVARVLSSTAFVHGEDVRLLEHEFAGFCGAAHACAVANGTDALHLALRAYGVGPGDEVVTVAFSFIATGRRSSSPGRGRSSWTWTFRPTRWIRRGSRRRSRPARR